MSSRANRTTPARSRLARGTAGETTELARSGRRGRTAWTALGSAILADALDGAASRKLSATLARYTSPPPAGRRHHRPRDPGLARDLAAAARGAFRLGALSCAAATACRAGLLVALLAAPVLAGCGGSGGEPAPVGAPATPPRPGTLAASASRVHRELGGIAQHALLLGDRAAPVTIMHEYADLDCATCSTVHRTVLPHVIARFVRSGEASLELRPLAARSRSRALARGVCASAQRQGWDFVEFAYARAGADGAPARLAHALGLDVRRWRADLRRPAWTPLILGALSVARIAHFPGYPVFLVRRAAAPSPSPCSPPRARRTRFAIAIAKALRSPA